MSRRPGRWPGRRRRHAPRRKPRRRLRRRERAEALAQQDYINRVNRAYREVQDDNVALAEDLLHGCPTGRRGWEWHFVERLCNAERLTLDLGNASVNALAFGPDGSWAVSGSGGTSSVGPSRRRADRRRVGHRDRPPPEDLARGQGSRLQRGRQPGRAEGRGGVRRRAWSWCGTPPPARSRGRGDEPPLYAMSVAFSPDGKSLAVGYGYYSGDAGREGQDPGRRVRGGDQVVPRPPGGVNELAFHPGGKRLAVAGSGVVEIWDLDTATKVRDLKGHTKWVYGVAFSPDGKTLATGGWDRTVKLWDVDAGGERSTIFAHEGFVLDLAFSPDGHNLATASEDRSLKLWEVPSGRLLAAFHGHTDFVQAVAFRPGGREVATGSLDGSLRFWDLRASRPVVVEHSGWVDAWRSAATGSGSSRSPDVTRTAADTTKGWNPLTGEIDPALAGSPLASPPAGFVAGSGLRADRPPRAPSASWSPRSAPTGGAGGPSRSKEYATSAVVIRDATTGRVVHTLTGHSADVVSATFSPDGRRLATASYDRTIKLWDTATGQDVFTLRGHTAGVVSLAFSPDGNLLVSGGIDNTARVWNATPLPSRAIAEHDARYQRKITMLEQLKATTDDAQRAEVLAGAANGAWPPSPSARPSSRAREPPAPVPARPRPGGGPGRLRRPARSAGHAQDIRWRGRSLAGRGHRRILSDGPRVDRRSAKTRGVREHGRRRQRHE